MIELVLDSNIWIHNIALDEPKGIFNQLNEFLDNGEIILLTNDVLLDEWNRNKEDTRVSIAKKIKDNSKKALEISEFLEPKEKSTLNKLILNYKDREEKRISLAINRIKQIDELFSKSTKMKVSKEMKLEVIDWALNKTAPFNKKKNSVADALILLSFVEHRKHRYNNGFQPKAYFISQNHTDYSSEIDKDIIHPDLSKLIDSVNINYCRYVNQTLSLVPDDLLELESMIDTQVEMYKEEKYFNEK